MASLHTLLGFNPVVTRLSRLQKRVDSAVAITPELMAAVLADGCPRWQQPSYAQDHQGVRRLFTVEAWADLTLLLIELELPNWNPRAIIHDDDEWSFILARRWPMEWLDLVERHENMSLAMLKAFLAARLCDEIPDSESPVTAKTSSTAPTTSEPMLCDNFR